MKKQHLFILLSFFCITLFFSRTFPQDNIQLLHIFEADSSEKNKLLFNLEQLEQIVTGFNLQEDADAIELMDQEGNILVVLGSIKKGKANWDHKAVNNSALLVKFSKEAFEKIQPKVTEKGDRPGLILQISDTKKALSKDQEYGKKPKYVESRTTLASCEITFQMHPDLMGTLTYPIKVTPGEVLDQAVAVAVENKGNTMARNITLELVLSSDTLIPDQLGGPTATYMEDALLEGGQETIATLKPGEQAVVTFKAGLKIPADTPPGRYYLAAVLDRENKIKEANEVNNKDVRFMTVAVPEPLGFTLLLPDTQLVYQPADFALSVMSQGAVISDGREWRKCMIQPQIHQVKHANWAPYHWEVYTSDRTVWDVRNADFCKKGGNASRVKTKVEVTGGSATTPPTRITILLPDTRLIYRLADNTFKIETMGNQIAHMPFWKCAKVESHIYHIKFEAWPDFFWEVDTFRKVVKKINDGTLGVSGGTATDLPITLEVN